MSSITISSTFGGCLDAGVNSSDKAAHAVNARHRRTRLSIAPRESPSPVQSRCRLGDHVISRTRAPQGSCSRCACSHSSWQSFSCSLTTHATPLCSLSTAGANTPHPHSHSLSADTKVACVTWTSPRWPWPLSHKSRSGRHARLPCLGCSADALHGLLQVRQASNGSGCAECISCCIGHYAWNFSAPFTNSVHARPP